MYAKPQHRILAALCLSVLGIAANAQSSSPAATSVAKPAAVPPKAAVNYSRLPLSFEPNRGQTSKEVQWLAHGPRRATSRDPADIAVRARTRTTSAGPRHPADASPGYARRRASFDAASSRKERVRCP